MGSGSFSAGISSSSGGSGLGTGLLKSLRRKLKPETKQKRVDNDVTVICNRVAKLPDFQDQFGSPLLDHAFKSLFRLSFDAFRRHSIVDTLEAAGAGTGSGCIREWTRSVIAGIPEENGAIRSLIRLSLDSFVMKALGNNLDVYFHGDAAAVTAALDQRVFAKTSNNFLAELINVVAAREIERVNKVDSEYIKNACAAKADQIIRSFEGTFLNKQQITYENFFELVGKNPDWFKRQFKK